MAVISIRYDEGSFEPNLGYKAVEFWHRGGDKEEIFNSGDFVKDWFNCQRFIIKEWDNEEPVSHSSSVDHFIMDGAKFDSAWLTVKDGKPVLVYDYCECIEFFVAEGTQPSWEELKSLVDGDKKEETDRLQA